MRSWMPLLCSLALLLPAGAEAGPWPREKGAGFVAPSIGVEFGGGDWQSIFEIYGEYGLTSQVTATGKLRFELPADGWRDGLAQIDATLRWYPAVAPLGLALGFEAGLRGVVRQNDDPQEIALDDNFFVEESELMPGLFGLLKLHAGRGVENRFGPGWARGTVELSLPISMNLEQYYIRENDGQRSVEVSIQYGVRPTDDWLAMVTVSAWYGGGDAYYKLYPAVGRRLAPGRDLIIEAMAETGSRGGVFGLRLGLWQEF